MEHGTWRKKLEKHGKTYTWKNMKKYSKFKTSAPARNDKVESPYELYSASY